MQLESFEDDATHMVQPDKGYEQGFADGYTQGLAAAKSEQVNLQQELIQSIADLEFNYQEVRGEIIRSLGPFFGSLSEKLFPQLIEYGFAGQIADVLTQAATADPTSKFSLSIHPDQQASVVAALDATSLNVALTTDVELSKNAAWVRYAQGAMHVDLDQLLADIRLILSAVDFIEARTENHG